MGTPAGTNSPSAVPPPKRSARSIALSVCVSIAYGLPVNLARTRFGELVLDEDLLWHHVRWPVLYHVLADLVDGALGRSVLERDDGHDELANLRVLDPEGASLVHETASYKEVLHLLRAQAVALGLDHCVVAPYEVEVAFLIPAGEVARIDNPLRIEELGWGQRVRAVRLLGGLLLAPVAHRHRRAPVDELSYVARGTLLAFLVYHEDLGVGDGLADTPTALGRGAVDLIGRQVGGAERLGKTVHQVDPRAGEAREEPLELCKVREGDASARVGDVAQVLERLLLYCPGASQQERPQRRHPCYAGDLVAPERAREVSWQPRALQYERRPHPERGGELAHPRVEVKRQSREDAVFAGVL